MDPLAGLMDDDAFPNLPSLPSSVTSREHNGNDHDDDAIGRPSGRLGRRDGAGDGQGEGQSWFESGRMGRRVEGHDAVARGNGAAGARVDAGAHGGGRFTAASTVTRDDNDDDEDLSFATDFDGHLDGSGLDDGSAGSSVSTPSFASATSAGAGASASASVSDLAQRWHNVNVLLRDAGVTPVRPLGNLLDGGAAGGIHGDGGDTDASGGGGGGDGMGFDARGVAQTAGRSGHGRGHGAGAGTAAAAAAAAMSWASETSVLASIRELLTAYRKRGDLLRDALVAHTSSREASDDAHTAAQALRTAKAQGRQLKRKLLDTEQRLRAAERTITTMRSKDGDVRKRRREVSSLQRLVAHSEHRVAAKEREVTKLKRKLQAQAQAHRVSRKRAEKVFEKLHKRSYRPASGADAKTYVGALVV